MSRLKDSEAERAFHSTRAFSRLADPHPHLEGHPAFTQAADSNAHLTQKLGHT